ncbi:hypothetical protein H9L12_10355 [Sphingomonas rhizophila]|uniref:Uncharacterized protein n=1 Tax=Sphingomonas rhizophila TaxID=2071607 RepID=A0A7G9S9Z7_9SPHN|nr:hypothetical protein [Sphingomonas rhizophila]QNN64672.1 hypothetical protein H9L12_10355 [Sphingomonas rhizophila]
MGIHWCPDDYLPTTVEPRVAAPMSSLAAKFPGVPLETWPSERRTTLVLVAALLWSAAGLIGGALGIGLLDPLLAPLR